ncbi:ester cyclase [Kallotenue papyrolyticum]|uniref:ester cyclase n=1 Tax=Kallotenue papyrolyticum TaxID=1325125 RepID=UPI000492668F|nr:ester cyclase [Kallotenue papyrolyticum]
MEQHKAVVRRIIEELWSQGDLALLDTLVAEELVNHPTLVGLPPGRAGFRQLITLMRTAFPDLRLSIDRLLAEDDRVVARVIAEGTHAGAVGGVPPSGHAARWSAIHIYRLEDGQVVERWGEAHLVDLLQQLGQLPPLGTDGAEPEQRTGA